MVLDKTYTSLMREAWGSLDLRNLKRSSVEIAEEIGVDEEIVRNRVKHRGTPGAVGDAHWHDGWDDHCMVFLDRIAVENVSGLDRFQSPPESYDESPTERSR